MLRYYQNYYFAQAYGQGDYSSCTYNCVQGASTSTGSGSGNGLVNTGIAVAAIVTIACLLIFIALIVRFIRRKPANKLEVAPESEEVEDEPQTGDPSQPR